MARGTAAIALTLLLDAAALAASGSCYQALNGLLHEVAERLAPSGSGDELRRRERPFQMMLVDDCAGASCTLRQSVLKFEPQ